MGAKQATIQISIKLPIEIAQKEKWVLASCPVLDVISQGKDFEDAKQNLTEALHVFLESCIVRGTLEQVLPECGFSPVSEEDGLIAEQAAADHVEIPLYFLAKQAEQNQCHPV